MLTGFQIQIYILNDMSPASLRKPKQAVIIHYRDIGIISAFAEEADKLAV